MTSTPRRTGYVLLALAVVLALVTVTVPTVRAGADAPLLLLEGFGADVPRPLAPDVERSEVVLDGVVGDLYDAGDGAPPVLLVPGAAPAGRSDARVVSLANGVARSGRTVFVPELSLFAQQIDLDDVDRVARAVRALSNRSDGRRVVLLGFSFGGSLSLVAAADDRARGAVRLVATFGAYADLVGVVQAVTTGASLVGDQRIPWEVPEQADELLPQIARDLVPDDEQDVLTAALEQDAPGSLPDEAAAVYALLTNTDPARTPELARQLGPTASTVLGSYSPATVADRLADVPVLAAHSRDDPAVPYAELLRLEQQLPHARTLTVESFRHVDLQLDGAPVGLVRDLLTSWSFARHLLAAQEPWPWQR